MLAYRSIYKILASLVVFSFLLSGLVGSPALVTAQFTPEGGGDSLPIADSTALRILEGPAIEPPVPPENPPDSGSLLGSDGLLAANLDLTRPIPPSMEEYLQVVEQMNAGSTYVPGEYRSGPDIPQGIDLVHNPDLTTIDSPIPVEEQSVEGLPTPGSMPDMVSGKVISSAGEPMSGTIVRAESQTHGFHTDTMTDGLGSYSFIGLPSDTYRLFVYDQDFRLIPLTSESQTILINTDLNQPEDYVLEVTQDSLVVDQTLETSSRKTTGIKTVGQWSEPMAGTGAISGTVTNGDGSPLLNVWASVYTTDYVLLQDAYTDANGFYSFSGLETGEYYVDFFCDEICDPDILLYEYYNNKSPWGLADPILVVDGYTTANIDAVLTTGGWIDGTVTSSQTSNPIEGVWVSAFDINYNLFGQTVTDANGYYLIPGLYTDSYFLEFSAEPTGNQSEWFNNKSDFGIADPVQVTMDFSAGPIDVQLDPIPGIYGRVTAEINGEPVASQVVLFSVSSSSYSIVGTEPNGYYKFIGVPTGQYKVGFDPLPVCDPQYNCVPSIYLREYYNNKPNSGFADVITYEGGVINGIDATLKRGSFIEGNVKASDGTTPLADVGIYVVDSSNSSYYAGQTDTNGNFRTSALAPGNYKLNFNTSGCSSPCADYLSEYYNDAATLETAAVIPVVDQTTTGGINAVLSLGGKISGTVTDEMNGLPIQSVWVNAWNSAFQTSTYTDSAGIFTLRGLPTGNYRVQFYPSDGQHIDEIYDNVNDSGLATPVQVTAPNETSGINAALDRGGSIRGVVRALGTNLPLETVGVMLFNEQGSNLSTVTTDSQGLFSMTGLRPGTYRIRFTPTYCPGYTCMHPEFQSEYYDNKSTLAEASPVTVFSDQVTSGIDAVLATGGSISGTVTVTNGDPINYFYTTIYLYDSENNYIRGTSVDALGNYTFTGLSAGNYKIQFTSTGYVQEYYDNKPTLAEANQITVLADQATNGINAVMSVGGVITGIVTDESTGDPLPDNYVSVYKAGYNTGDYTDVNGVYRVVGLPEGSYKVRFGGYPTYLTEYYNDKVTFDTADPVQVSGEIEIANINAALTKAGKISGTATGDPGSLPLETIGVIVYDGTGNWVGTTNTDAQGNYVITGLSSGNYIVKFDPTYCVWSECLHPEYMPEYYDNHYSFADANLVAVTTGQETANINAVLEIGAEISGTVTDKATTLPVSDVWVSIYNESFSKGVYTDQTGAYSINGIPTGSYVVRFDSNGRYVTEYYNGKFGDGQANLVQVTAPNVLTGINASLIVGGKVTGVVTDEDTGDPLENISVRVGNDNFYKYANTGVDGIYSAQGIPSGTYRVAFYTGNNSLYVPEYYNNQQFYSNANLITVTAPETVSGIHAQLAKGASISGVVVSDEDGLPLEDVNVYVTDLNNNSWITSTNSEGYYSHYGLYPGTYRLEFNPGGSNNSRTLDHMREYYKDALTINEAQLINLVAGQAAVNYDASLALGSKITGKVTAADGVTPLEGVGVNAYSYSSEFGRDYVTYAYTDILGNYTLGGLSAGQYYVYFVPEISTDYVAESYNNKEYWNEGDLITVPIQTTVSGIDAALETGRHIRGSLTEAVGGAPITTQLLIGVYDEDYYWRAWGLSDENGNYSTYALPPGTYRLEFRPSAWTSSSMYLDEFYDDRPSFLTATPITLGSDADAVNHNAALDSASQITGKVTSSGSALGIGNAQVRYYNRDYRYYYSGLSGYVYTASDGTYLIPGLEPGNYEVCVEPVGEYFQQCLAEIDVAASSQVTDIDFIMQPGGRISGRVTADGSQLPLDDVYIEFYDQQGSYITSNLTSLTGDYLSSPLPPGDYRIMFWPAEDGTSKTYLSELYNNQTTFAAATLVTVSASQTTSSINASLARGGTVSGTVTRAADDLPVQYATVYLIPTTGGLDYYTYKYAGTDANGQYTITGVAPGSYRVEFDAPYGENLLFEYYPGVKEYNQAQEIFVASLGSLTGIDATLDPGGQISGRVVAAGSNDPLQWAQIRVSRSGNNYYGYANTDSNGDYTVGGLPAGDYTVLAQGDVYAMEFYGGLQTPAQIPVTPGSTVPNIDFALEKGSVIAGWVKGVDTLHNQPGYVSVYNSSGTELETYGANNPRGFYEMVLPAGEPFKLEYSPNNSLNGYVPTFYDQKHDLTTADPITLTPGEVRYPVNGLLLLGGKISGTVTTAQHGPVEGVEVSLYNPQWDYMGGTLTDAAGNYTVSGLPDGEYLLLAHPYNVQTLSGYMYKFYNNKYSFETADPITVTNGGQINGINVQLDKFTVGFATSSQTVAEGAGTIAVSVSLDAPAPFGLEVPFSVGGTASGGGVDHTLFGGFFLINEGETTGTVQFNIVNDTLDETNETLVITLGQVNYLTLGAIQVKTITIEDDDITVIEVPAPVISQVTPAQGLVGVPVELVIDGQNFTSGAAVTLKAASFSLGLSTTYVNAGRLRAVVPATVLEGLYDLEVSNPDGKTAAAAGAYRVLPPVVDDLYGNSYELWTDPGTIYAGTTVNVGMVVQRQGGIDPLPEVAVDFYLGNPLSGGVKVGSGSVQNLAAGAWGSTAGFSWTAPAAGTYTLYAVIDPSGLISETVEGNNTVARIIKVMAVPEPLADVTPPTVTAFSINGNAVSTSSAQVSAMVTASDGTGGSGVNAVMFIEYDFFEGIDQWVQVHATDWLPYHAATPYLLTLTGAPGAKYVQAWAADQEGNVSLEPMAVFINYIPATDTLVKDQSRYYVYPLTTPRQFTGTVTPLSGDPDLYIWSPDFLASANWMSLASTGPDSITLIVPVNGMYVVQVHAYTDTTYQFSGVESPMAGPGSGTLAGELQAGKQPISDPGLVPGSTPSEQRGIPDAPLDVPPTDNYFVFLPLIKR